MQTTWIHGLAAAAVTTTGVWLLLGAESAAQTPSAQAGKVTVSGCVERADQVTPGPAVAANADPDSLTFVLVSAEKRTTAETTPEHVDARKHVLYRLQGAQSMLNPHVGHHVEVKGAAPATRQTPGVDPAMPANAPVLNVEQVRMIAETCPR